MPKILAVISVIGKDQKGIVARFATYVAEHQVNIEDLQQHVVRGLFLMDMLVDVSDMTLSLDELITGLLATGKEVGMDVRVTLRSHRREKKTALLVSKEPHCLERFIDAWRDGELGGKIACVLANHETLRGMTEEAGIPFESMPSTDKPAHMAWVRKRLEHYGVDVVVLARYMQILTNEVVSAFRYKIVNIHPSLLPHFPGPAPYRQAFEEGVRVSGCTAHFVTEALDEGPIILQDVFHVDVGRDSVEDIKRKGRALEADVLLKSVKYVLNEELVVVEDRVVFKPGLNNLLDAEERNEPAAEA